MNVTSRPVVHFGKKPAAQPKPAQEKHVNEAKVDLLASKPAGYQKGNAFGV
jgi:hypothetical protein